MSIKAEGSTKFTFEITETGADSARARIEALQQAINQLKASANSPIHINISMSKDAQSLFKNNKGLLTQAKNMGKSLGEVLSDGVKDALNGKGKKNDVADAYQKQLKDQHKEAAKIIDDFIDAKSQPVKTDEMLDRDLDWADKRTKELEEKYKKFQELKKTVEQGGDEKAKSALSNIATDMLGDIESALNQRGDAVWKELAKQKEKLVDYQSELREELNKAYASEKGPLTGGEFFSTEKLDSADHQKQVEAIRKKYDSQGSVYTEELKALREKQVKERQDRQELIRKASALRDEIANSKDIDEINSLMNGDLFGEAWSKATQQKNSNVLQQDSLSSKGSDNRKRKQAMNAVQDYIDRKTNELNENKKNHRNYAGEWADQQIQDIRGLAQSFDQALKEYSKNPDLVDNEDNLIQAGQEAIAKIDSLQGDSSKKLLNQEGKNLDSVQNIRNRMADALNKLTVGRSYDKKMQDGLLQIADEDIYKSIAKEVKRQAENNERQISRMPSSEGYEKAQAQNKLIESEIAKAREAQNKLYQSRSDQQTEGILQSLSDSFDQMYARPEAEQVVDAIRNKLPETFKNADSLGKILADDLDTIRADYMGPDRSADELNYFVDDLVSQVEEGTLAGQKVLDGVKNSLNALDVLPENQYQDLFDSWEKNNGKGNDSKSPERFVREMKDQLSQILKNYSDLDEGTLKELDGFDFNQLKEAQTSIRDWMAARNDQLKELPEFDVKPSQESVDFQNRLNNLIGQQSDATVETISFDIDPPLATTIAQLNELKSSLNAFDQPVKIKVELDDNGVADRIQAWSDKLKSETTKAVSDKVIKDIKDESKEINAQKRKAFKEEDVVEEPAGKITFDSNIEEVGSKLKDISANIIFQSNIEELTSQIQSMEGHITFSSNLDQIAEQIEGQKRRAIWQGGSQLEDVKIDTALTEKVTKAAKTQAEQAKQIVKTGTDTVKKQKAEILSQMGAFIGADKGLLRKDIFDKSKTSKPILEASNFLARLGSFDSREMQQLAERYPDEYKDIQQQKAKATQLLNQVDYANKHNPDKVKDIHKALYSLPSDEIVNKELAAQIEKGKEEYRKVWLNDIGQQIQQEAKRPTKKTSTSQNKDQSLEKQEEVLKSGLTLTGELSKGENTFSITVSANGIEEAKSALSSLQPQIESLREISANPIHLNLSLSNDAKGMLSGDKSFLDKFESSGQKMASSLTKGMTNVIGKEGQGPKKEKAVNLLQSYMDQEENKLQKTAEAFDKDYRKMVDKTKERLDKSYSEFSDAKQGLTFSDLTERSKTENATKTAENFLADLKSYSSAEMKTLQKKMPEVYKDLEKKRKDATQYLNRLSMANGADEDLKSDEALKKASSKSLFSSEAVSRIEQQAERKRISRENQKQAQAYQQKQEDRKAQAKQINDNLSKARQTEKRIGGSSSDYETSEILRGFADSLNPSEKSIADSVRSVAKNLRTRLGDAIDSYSSSKAAGGDFSDFYAKMAESSLGGKKPVGSYVLDTLEDMNKMSDSQLSSLAKNLSVADPERFKNVTSNQLKQIRSTLGDMASTFSNAYVDGFQQMDGETVEKVQSYQNKFNKQYNKMFEQGENLFQPNLGVNLGSSSLSDQFNSIVSSANEVTVPNVDIQVNITPDNISDQINQIKSALEGLDAKEVQINVSVNTEAAMAELESFQQRVQDVKDNKVRSEASDVERKPDIESSAPNKTYETVKTSDQADTAHQVEKITAPTGEVTGTVTANDIKGDSAQISSANVQEVQTGDQTISVKAKILNVEGPVDQVVDFTGKVSKVEGVDGLADKTVDLVGELKSLEGPADRSIELTGKLTSLEEPSNTKIKVNAEAEGLDGEKIRAALEQSPVTIRFDTNIEEIQAQLNSMKGHVDFDSNIDQLQSKINTLSGLTGADGKVSDSFIQQAAQSVRQKMGEQAEKVTGKGFDLDVETANKNKQDQVFSVRLDQNDIDRIGQRYQEVSRSDEKSSIGQSLSDFMNLAQEQTESFLPALYNDDLKRLRNAYEDSLPDSEDWKYFASSFNDRLDQADLRSIFGPKQDENVIKDKIINNAVDRIQEFQSKDKTKSNTVELPTLEKQDLVDLRKQFIADNVARKKAQQEASKTVNEHAETAKSASPRDWKAVAQGYRDRLDDNALYSIFGDKQNENVLHQKIVSQALEQADRFRANGLQPVNNKASVEYLPQEALAQLRDAFIAGDDITKPIVEKAEKAISSLGTTGFSSYEPNSARNASYLVSSSTKDGADKKVSQEVLKSVQKQVEDSGAVVVPSKNDSPANVFSNKQVQPQNDYLTSGGVSLPQGLRDRFSTALNDYDLERLAHKASLQKIYDQPFLPENRPSFTKAQSAFNGVDFNTQFPLFSNEELNQARSGIRKRWEKQVGSGSFVPDAQYLKTVEDTMSRFRVIDQQLDGLQKLKTSANSKGESTIRYDNEEQRLKNEIKALSHSQKEAWDALDKQYSLPGGLSRTTQIPAEELLGLYGWTGQAGGEKAFTALQNILTDVLRSQGIDADSLQIKSEKDNTYSVKYAEGDKAVEARLALKPFTGADGEEIYGFYQNKPATKANDLVSRDAMPDFILKVQDQFDAIENNFKDATKYLKAKDMDRALAERDRIVNDLIDEVSKPGTTRDQANKALNKALKQRDNELSEIDKRISKSRAAGTLKADDLDALSKIEDGQQRTKAIEKMLKQQLGGRVKLVSEEDDGYVVERKVNGARTRQKITPARYTGSDEKGNDVDMLALQGKTLGGRAGSSKAGGWKSWGTNVAKKFASLTEYLTSMFLADKVMSELMNGVEFVKQANTSMSNIGMTMNASQDQLDNLKAKAIQAGVNLKADSNSVIEAATVYANANETADSILEKAQPTVLLANASQQSASVVADQIQAVQNQFDGLDNASERIVNSYEKISAGSHINAGTCLEAWRTLCSWMLSISVKGQRWLRPSKDQL